jgi:Domain of unknown function (DUF222)
MFVYRQYFPSTSPVADGPEEVVFERVRNAVNALKATARNLDPLCVDGQDAAALFEIVGESERVCAAKKALMARRVDETGMWRTGGHRTAAHWVAEATGATVGAAARTLETAKALERLPDTDAAFRSGRLSEVQAAEITATAVSDAGAEVDLLEAARSTTVKGLRDRCREVRAGAEVDDRACARRLHVMRSAHEWTDPDGAYRLEARLAPDAGARFSSARKAHIDRIFCDARRAGRREPRTAYAADALVALASEGPCKPVDVRVTVDSGALARGHTEAGERCEITGIGPAPVTTARALLDDAAVTVMVRDGDDVTAVSSPKRTIRRSCVARSTPGTRRAASRVVRTISSRDRPHHSRRRPRTDRALQSVAHLLAPPRAQELLGLDGRWRQRQPRPRSTR